MLESGMKETRDAIIHIGDATPAAVQGMLQYLYTSRMPDDVKLSDIFMLAHRYDITALQDEAGRRMLENITTENVRERAGTLLRHKGTPLVNSLWEEMYNQLHPHHKDVLKGILED